MNTAAKNFSVLFFLFLTAPALLDASSAVRPLFRQKPQEPLVQKMEGVKSFSGAAWLPQQEHYLLLSSKPSALHEISVFGNRVQKTRTVKLRGFKTLSAVTYVGRAESDETGVRIALTEESRAEVNFCDLSPEQGELKKEKCRVYEVKKLMLWEKKFGIEGAATDRSGDVPVFYFGKEKMPKQIYRGYFEDGRWNMGVAWDAEAMMPAESIISDLYFNGSLYVLDGTGARVFQMDPLTGQTVSEFHFKKSKKHRFSGFCFRQEQEKLEVLITSNANRYFFYRFPAFSKSALKES